jgi:hypothetical protein
VQADATPTSNIAPTLHHAGTNPACDALRPVLYAQKQPATTTPTHKPTSTSTLAAQAHLGPTRLLNGNTSRLPATCLLAEGPHPQGWRTHRTAKARTRLSPRQPQNVEHLATRQPATTQPRCWPGCNLPQHPPWPRPPAAPEPPGNTPFTTATTTAICGDPGRHLASSLIQPHWQPGCSYTSHLLQQGCTYRRPSCRPTSSPSLTAASDMTLAPCAALHAPAH